MNLEQTYYGCFDGLRGLELAMTGAQAQSCSHQGQCDEDCEALAKNPDIAKQLDAFGADKLRTALKEYGAWDADELDDNDANRIRVIWSAACDIKENNRL